jgi:Domain of unknown function (DUF4279)
MVDKPKRTEESKLIVDSRLTPLDDKYATCERTTATLRIACGAMHPQQVTTLLNVEPTRQTVRGERMQFSSRAKSYIPRLNMWLLDSEGVILSKDLRRHLDWIIGKVRPHRDALLSLQQLPDVKMDVTCVWWSQHGDGGPTLWPEQMLGLGELNLEMSIAVAFYGDEPDE